MIEIENSRDGDITAKNNNVYMHSAYSPQKEALKFFRNNNLEKYKTFILIGPCLNYIADIIRESNKSAKIISIYFETLFYENDKGRSDFLFNFSSDVSLLSSFLTASVSELDLEGLKVLEWPPALKFHKDSAARVKSLVSQLIRELHGNITTISGFGKKHFKNFVKNYLFIENFLQISRSTKPVVLAGSGPGLAENLDFILKHRGGIILLALPSSVRFLLFHGLKPDIIISTDPGYYAGLHLYEGTEIPVAAPLTASLPPATVTGGVILFNQGSYIENMVPAAASYPYIPANGTVAGSALYLSALLSSGPVFVSGLDFSFVDLTSHNRPHTFDSLIEAASERIKPLHSLYFKRNITNSERVSGHLRTNHALKTYAGWFASKSGQFNGNCYFLNDSPAPDGFRNISYAEAENCFSAGSNPEFTEYSPGYYPNRRETLSDFIKRKITLLDNLLIEINKHNTGEALLGLLANDIIFNLFLPDLLEFKRHYLNKKGKEAQNKAVSLIIKTGDFLKENLEHV